MTDHLLYLHLKGNKLPLGVCSTVSSRLSYYKFKNLSLLQFMDFLNSINITKEITRIKLQVSYMQLQETRTKVAPTQRLLEVYQS